jgi:hypothetical protein
MATLEFILPSNDETLNFLLNNPSATSHLTYQTNDVVQRGTDYNIGISNVYPSGSEIRCQATPLTVSARYEFALYAASVREGRQVSMAWNASYVLGALALVAGVACAFIPPAAAALGVTGISLIIAGGIVMVAVGGAIQYQQDKNESTIKLAELCASGKLTEEECNNFIPALKQNWATPITDILKYVGIVVAVGAVAYVGIKVIPPMLEKKGKTSKSEKHKKVKK